MKINVATCGRCDGLIHKGEEVKGCDRCGRISKTHGYDHAVAVEREELIKIINKALRSETKMTIMLTRAHV